MNFYEARELTKQGKAIRSRGWNGKGMFVFGRPADKLPHEFIPNVKYLPEGVKKFLAAQNRDIEFTFYLCLYTADGRVSNGWTPNNLDLERDDWEEVQFDNLFPDYIS